MPNRNELRYEMRITFGLSSLLSLTLLPLFALYYWYAWRHGADCKPVQLTMGYEAVWSLSVCLSAAHLMAVEPEARLAELRTTYPESAWRVPALRTAGALLLAAVPALLGALIFRGGYGPYELWPLLQDGIPPMLYLLGISMLITNLLQNYWGGVTASFGYWFFEFLTRGAHTQRFFLFNGSWPLDQVDHDLNRWWLVGAGVALLLVNAWVSAVRKDGLGWAPRR